MKSVSYRMDAMYITLTPEEKDFRTAFNERGYELRDPHEGEAVRVQRGYRPENALMLDIQIGEREDEIFTLTVQTRLEKDGNETGFIAMSGEQLDYIPYEDIVRTYKDWVKCTRADVAADITYTSKEELDKAHINMCKKVGFNPKRGNFTQNPKNSIAGGRRNSKKPIRTASLIASNGLTLYVGGRQSKFMVRAYDKSAEVLAKTEEVIPPTLRIELEVKQEIANGIVKELINSVESGHSQAPTFWHTLSDDHIAFKKRVNTETLAEVMGMDKAEIIELDYSKIEGVSLEFEKWVRGQVSPKFNRLYGHMNLEEKIRSISKMGLLSPLEIEIILTALIQAEMMESIAE